MIYSVDRIEGEYIVLVSDDGEARKENRNRFSCEIREGDVFLCENETFIPCVSIAEARKKRVRAWMDQKKTKEL